MSLHFILSCLGIGAVAGVCSGMFGIGGGIVIIPLLVFLLSLPIQQAAAVSLVAMLAPVGILGVWEYSRQGLLGRKEFFLGSAIAVGLLIGAFFGAKISIFLGGEKVQKAFSLLLVAAAAKIWFTKH